MDVPALDLLSGRELVEDCVHCGFCLDSCPTYLLWARETDSPRGRIVLIADAIAAGGAVSDAMAAHLDTCLGCMACVSACPSGVRYDRLLTPARAAVERADRRPARERALRRLLFETLPHPRRLRALLPLLAASQRARVGRRLPEQLKLLLAVAPQIQAGAPGRAERIPERTPAQGRQRGRVGLLLGCVQRVFFADVNRATVGTLAAEGYEVLAPRLPDCCGALHLHSGEQRQGLERARATIAAFARAGGPTGLDHIVVNAAGCGSAMKDYGELLGTPEARAFSARVRDVCELLASEPARAPRGAVPLRVAYHDACHLRHAQHVRDQPRQLLRAIPGVELVEAADEVDICCGSAGIYNIVQPQAAARLGERKARLLLDTGADVVAAGNPGCAAQLDRHLRELGRPLPIHHPVELVWRSIVDAP